MGLAGSAAAPGSLITSVRPAPLGAASCLAIPANPIPQSIGERPAFRGEQSRPGGAGRVPPQDWERPGARRQGTPPGGDRQHGAWGGARWGRPDRGRGDAEVVPTHPRGLPEFCWVPEKRTRWARAAETSSSSSSSAPSQAPLSLPLEVPQVGCPWAAGGKWGVGVVLRGGEGIPCPSAPAGGGGERRNETETSLFTKYIFKHVKSGVGYRRILATAEG